MKILFKLLLLPLALIVLFTQCEKDPELVNIPDDAFLTALIELGVDTDGDGQISASEAEVVTSINVMGKNISDMTGIEAFYNLDTLHCAYNQLSALDVSNNTGLIWLVCGVNQLSNLDVSKNTTLEYLACNSSQLSELDVSDNLHLTTLDCTGNQLSSLDVSNNTELQNLYCGKNGLSDLDLSNNPSLRKLFCSRNQFNTLDISKNTRIIFLSCFENTLSDIDFPDNSELRDLHCYQNQLSSLDVTGLPFIETLKCQENMLTNLLASNASLNFIWCGDNNLTKLDIRLNTALIVLSCTNIPTLEQVCVWETPFPPEGVTIDTLGSPNVYFTTECSK